MIADPVCRVRACRREVLEEIAGYSVQQHFLPLLAAERGFRIAEVEVRRGQPTEDSRRGSAASASCPDCASRSKRSPCSWC